MNALLSVSDKTGVLDLARALHALGIRLLSTGGTAKLLADHGLPVTEVAEMTGFPEMLDGRVKTLHPKVHGGLLARRDVPAHMQALADHGIDTIDLLVVNLYPFEATVARPGCTLEEAIENIDIGGPAMVRSAAKNWKDVAVLTDASQYETVIAELLSFVERLRPMVADTALELHQALEAGKTVLFEGGQATMLDVDHGTYPFVTSSNATAGGAATGSGVGPGQLKTIIGIVKAYTTRVGSGPFPTELFDQWGELLRATGNEFGTTTGRPRRCGWYDAPIARYSARINGLTDFVLTKLDVLTGIESIPVCVAYDVDGVRHEEVPVSQSDFHHAKPIYQDFPGWHEDISTCRTFEELPRNAQDYILALEKLSGCRISAIGVGPARDAIIVRHNMLERA